MILFEGSCYLERLGLVNQHLEIRSSVVTILLLLDIVWDQKPRSYLGLPNTSLEQISVSQSLTLLEFLTQVEMIIPTP